MIVTLAIPTLNRFDLLAVCVASAYAGTRPPDRVVVVDNSGGNCPPIAGADIVLGRQPQSVARAWNDAARLAGDNLILCNDDIQFAPNTIARLIKGGQEHPHAAIVSAIEGQRFACFWLRWGAYQIIGPFDEQFEPAYYEDNDWHRRIQLAGWESPVAVSAVEHVNSATFQAKSPEEQALHHAQFRANHDRYLRKWGNPPGREVYTDPYNGAMPS